MNCQFCNEKNDLIKYINTHGDHVCVCSNCLLNKNIHINECYRCQNKYEINYSDNDEMCHSCYMDEYYDEIEEYYTLPWEYRPDPIFFGGEKNDSNKLFMGIELETDDGERSLITKLAKYLPYHYSDHNLFGYNFFWGKEDGSLNNGMEIVSHPATLEFHKNTPWWKQVLKKIVDAELKSNDCSTCGIHIHTNTSYFNTEQIHKLDALVNLYSRIFRRFARRNSREYAIYNPNKNLNHLGRNNNGDSRYSCLNFHNSNTIEWRIFKGNLKYESIMALFELVQGVSDFVKQDCITLDFIYNDKENCKRKLKQFLEEQNFQYLPSYTEMCRVWRDLETTQGQ